MDLNKTHITVVLDRSGSMGIIREATIEAVNGYVATQQEESGECLLTLVQFDDRYQVDCATIPIQDFAPLTLETYQPRGSTALLDAIGRTILENGRQFAAMSEADRPGMVLFVIQTDGQENSSQEFDLARINDLIAEHRDKYNWQFVFLGADQDAIASAAAMGISAGSSLAYSHSARGQHAAFAAMAKNTSKFRSARSAGDAESQIEFDEFDRNDSIDE
ncbi:vWA domain-containing protein [Thalassoroseus pseudoceratinae]|uniref:vWA domain-containing protein n=1 Tax=Thalassoroseus pseudoceratinae TaxID=2713176 RepID=UPI0014243E6F|nr:vWA domain-containing protein [Thalassoroseus pseudoceratinae]